MRSSEREMENKQDNLFNVFGSRTLIEGSVIFSMFKNCELFDDYKLSSNDFKTEEGKLLFKIGSIINDKGYTSTIDRTTLEIELSHHPDLKKELDDFGGSRAIM